MFNNKFVIVFYLSIVFITDVSVAESTTLNSSTCGDDIGTRIYELYDIDFDLVENKLVLYTNKSSSGIFYKKPEIIDIWNVKITIDDKPYAFIPRLLISDIGQQPNKTYFANYTIPLFDNKPHTIVIEFKSNNVKEVVSKHLYPFDVYQFSQRRNIENEMSRISHYKLPDVDIETTVSIRGNATYYLPGKVLPPIIFDLQPRAIQNKNEVITSEFGIKKNKICGISVVATELLKTESEEIGLSEMIEAEVYEYPVIESHSITFRRSFFPSIFLFLVLGAFTIFLTLYNMANETTRKGALYKVYVQASLLIILAEFTVGILPPSRPLTLTLFDTIIVWPLIISFLKKRENMPD